MQAGWTWHLRCSTARGRAAVRLDKLVKQATWLQPRPRSPVPLQLEHRRGRGRCGQLGLRLELGRERGFEA
jgi:hypothetical protein